jgi:hypothetical protein
MTKAQVYSYRDGLAVPIEAPPEEAASAPPFPHADALAVLKGLVDLLLDPKAARARIAEFADAVAKAGEAVSAVKKAEGDRDRVYAEIEEAKKRADEKHASCGRHTAPRARR